MKSAEELRFKRETAIKSVTTLLGHLEEQKKKESIEFHIRKFIDEAFPSWEQSTAHQEETSAAINTALENEINGSFRTQVGELVRTLFAPSLDLDTKERALSAINTVLKTEVQPNYIVRNIDDAEAFTTNLMKTLDHKYQDTPRKFDAFLLDIHPLTVDLPENHPLKTYQRQINFTPIDFTSNNVTALKAQLLEALEQAYPNEKAPFDCFLNDILSGKVKPSLTNPIYKYAPSKNTDSPETAVPLESHIDRFIESMFPTQERVLQQKEAGRAAINKVLSAKQESPILYVENIDNPEQLTTILIPALTVAYPNQPGKFALFLKDFKDPSAGLPDNHPLQTFKSQPYHEIWWLKRHRLDTVRMLDREIGGLLANPASPYSETYKAHSPTIFPRGLEGTEPNKDLILLLNSAEAALPELKNPEKGVAQIIGKELAEELFTIRGEALDAIEKAVIIEAIEKARSLEALEKIKALTTVLTRTDSWARNIEANKAALTTLQSYIPEQDGHYRQVPHSKPVDALANTANLRQKASAPAPSIPSTMVDKIVECFRPVFSSNERAQTP